MIARNASSLATLATLATLASVTATVLAVPASAQQASASVAAFGMAGNYTALARGYDAVAWNPANLALQGNPKFTLSLLTLGGDDGLGPVNLGDIKQYQNTTLSQDVKQSWLSRVTAQGGENGRAGFGVALIALSAGSIAFQVSTVGTMDTKMTPDAFQAVMFGNAGYNGAPQNLNFTGSHFDASAFTTGALSIAMPLVNAPGSHLSLGITGKYVVGNFVVHAMDQNSAVTINNVQVQFPIVYSGNDSTFGKFSPSSAMAGNGIGADVGLAWSNEQLTWTGVVQNVVNTFSWDQTKLWVRPASVTFDGTTNSSNFGAQPFAAAPQSLKNEIANDKFKPVLATGVAYKATRVVMLTADARQQMGDGIEIGPKTQVGGGVEFRGVPSLPVRGGVAYVTGGWSAAAGLGLKLGSFELSAAGMLRNRDSEKETGVMLSLISVH